MAIEATGTFMMESRRQGISGRAWNEVFVSARIADAGAINRWVRVASVRFPAGDL
jgi:hypothetical protein